MTSGKHGYHRAEYAASKNRRFHPAVNATLGRIRRGEDKQSEGLKRAMLSEHGRIQALIDAEIKRIEALVRCARRSRGRL